MDEPGIRQAVVRESCHQHMIMNTMHASVNSGILMEHPLFLVSKLQRWESTFKIVYISGYYYLVYVR